MISLTRFQIRTIISFEGPCEHTRIDGAQVRGLKGSQRVELFGQPLGTDVVKVADVATPRIEEVEAYLSRMMGLRVRIMTEASE